MAVLFAGVGAGAAPVVAVQARVNSTANKRVEKAAFIASPHEPIGDTKSPNVVIVVLGELPTIGHAGANGVGDPVIPSSEDAAGVDLGHVEFEALRLPG